MFLEVGNNEAINLALVTKIVQDEATATFFLISGESYKLRKTKGVAALIATTVGNPQAVADALTKPA